MGVLQVLRWLGAGRAVPPWPVSVLRGKRPVLGPRRDAEDAGAHRGRRGAAVCVVEAARGRGGVHPRSRGAEVGRAQTRPPAGPRGPGGGREGRSVLRVASVL